MLVLGVLTSFPVLLIYAASLPTFPLPVVAVFRPAIVLLALGLLCSFALTPFCRPFQRRTVLLSGFFTGLLSFVVSSNLGDGYWLRTGKPVWLLALFHLLLGCGLSAYLSSKKRFALASRGLRLAAATIVLTSGAQAILVPMQDANWLPAAQSIIDAAPVVVPAQAPRPDIVHIVFDGLAGPRVLRSHYGLDVSSNLSSLESQGFSLFYNAQSNYVNTYSSLASLLNAGYLDPLAFMEGSADRRPLKHLIDNSSVLQSLKAAGYQIALATSGYSATASLPLADRESCAGIGLSELEAAVYRYSPLRLFTLEWLTYEPYRRRIRCQLNALSEYADAPAPSYVFAHLTLPHPPFAFTADGRPAPAPRPLFGLQDADDFPGAPDVYLRDYKEQTRFALAILDQVVSQLLARDNPPVIIVSGDHGPASRFSHREPDGSDLVERFSTFLAVRWLSPEPSSYKRTTLANVYRLVYKNVYGVEAPLLKDRHIFSTFDQPYRFMDVTWRLHSESGLYSRPGPLNPNVFVGHDYHKQYRRN